MSKLLSFLWCCWNRSLLCNSRKLNPHNMHINTGWEAAVDGSNEGVYFVRVDCMPKKIYFELGKCVTHVCGSLVRVQRTNGRSRAKPNIAQHWPFAWMKKRCWLAFGALNWIDFLPFDVRPDCFSANAAIFSRYSLRNAWHSRSRSNYRTAAE